MSNDHIVRGATVAGTNDGSFAPHAKSEADPATLFGDGLPSGTSGICPQCWRNVVRATDGAWVGDQDGSPTCPAGGEHDYRGGDRCVVMSGGLVCNDTCIDVVDLDFMDDATFTSDEFRWNLLDGGALAKLHRAGAVNTFHEVVEWARQSAKEIDYEEQETCTADLEAELAQLGPMEEKPGFTGRDTFALVEGGIVQNDPVVPVFDLDDLYEGEYDDDPAKFAEYAFGDDGIISQLHACGSVLMRNEVISVIDRRMNQFTDEHSESLRQLFDKELAKIGVSLEEI